MDYEIGRANLSNLVEWFAKNSEGKMNEAATRFHLINEIFFNCLGWEKDSFIPEESQDKEYSDYTFKNPHRCLIVEAKKEGVYFELPAGNKKIDFKISSITKDNLNIKAAIEQALRYCLARGVEYGAVTNGHQLIAFLANRNDGIAPLEGKAIVFDSLSNMADNFLVVWQCLSPDGVREKRMTLHLTDSSLVLLPPKLSSKLHNFPGNIIRNTLQVDLQIVSEVVLEDVVKNEEIEVDFVKETYCTSGALSQYALVSKTILETRYSLLFEQKSEGQPLVKEAVTKKGVSKEIFAEGLSSRPILLIGDVGAGKSMFIKYLRGVEAKEIFGMSYTIYIDLGSKAAMENDIKLFVQQEVENIFRERYNIDFEERNFVRGVYHGELIRFSKGIYADLKELAPIEYKKHEVIFLEEKLRVRYEHIKECLLNITKSWKKQVIIFIDNVDQRDKDVQEDAFFIANEMAQNWPATVFLTIRPTTFYQSKKVGALSGYHPKAFSIAPPRVDEVLIKRLAFAKKISQGQVQSSQLPELLTINLKTLTQFIEILEYSFLNNSDLKECIDNICQGNIRMAIEFLTTFIGSGHINTQKILDIDDEHLNKQDGTRYLVAVHEFLRALIFKDNFYYNPLSSPVLNLFDLLQADPKEHFICPIFLDYFERYVGHANAEGFLETKDIVEFLQNFGYNYKQIEFCFARCYEKGLIETEGRAAVQIDVLLPNYLRITSKGAYHIKRLIIYFTYIDPIVVDTPILDAETRRRVDIGFDLENRIRRVIYFCDYMDNQWKHVNKAINGFDWLGVSKAIRIDIRTVRTKMSYSYRS